MEIKIDLDLPSIIAHAVSAERIQPLVNKAIAEAVGAAIRDATDYSSPFRKALETQLKDAMPHGLAIDDVAKFQLMANSAVTEAVMGANAETIKTAIAQGLKSSIPDVPERIKLSELVGKAREAFHKERHEAFMLATNQASMAAAGFRLIAMKALAANTAPTCDCPSPKTARSIR